MKRCSGSATRGRNVGTRLSVSERGVRFRSYLDGSTIELTPESAVEAQKALGADIIIPLDELPPLHVSRARLAASVALSHRWMARSLRTHLDDRRQQAMYGVVHGGVDRELRAASAAALAAMPFDGYAVGGSLGKVMSPPGTRTLWPVAASLETRTLAFRRLSRDPNPRLPPTARVGK